MTAEVFMWLLLAHAAGDYVLQSDWMAQGKTKRWWPAAVHAVAYGIPFVPLVPSVWAWLVIVGTHGVIDRYRLARYVVWARNQLAPAAHRATWTECRATGSSPERPEWLAAMLVIIVDNTIHVTINLLAVMYL